MRENTLISLLALVPFFLVSGCATTQGPKTNVGPDMAGQVQMLQNELQVKDQQIQDLQYEIETLKQKPASASVDKGNIVRVKGVTVADVQKALTRAGLNPGPVDGKAGNRTKEAIKEFQRRNGLKPDGIVGERTWSYLK